MPKTKVKSDNHGLYVRTGGYVFRPYHSYGYDPRAIDDGKTIFIEGQEVNARHVACSTTGILKDNNIEEYWESHGSYYDNNAKIINSNDVWKNRRGNI